MSSHEIKLGFDSDPITELVRRIGKAKRSIDAVVYKCNHRKAFKAIKSAAEKGRIIRLLVDRRQVNDGVKKEESLIPWLVGLDNVEIRKWPREKLHVKFTIVDDKRVLCGSYNWTKRTKNPKVELLQQYKKTDDVRRFREIFDTFWASGKKVKKVRHK